MIDLEIKRKITENNGGTKDVMIIKYHYSSVTSSLYSYKDILISKCYFSLQVYLWSTIYQRLAAALKAYYLLRLLLQERKRWDYNMVDHCKTLVKMRQIMTYQRFVHIFKGFSKDENVVKVTKTVEIETIWSWW